jgi:ferredoxin
MPGKEREIRNNFTDRCTACGFCAAMCPAFFHRTPDVSNTEVQKQVRSYLEGGVPERAVKERSRLCNECYKCVTDTCPEGLDPMRINQLLRGLLHKEGIAPRPFIPPSDPQSNERIIAALLTTEEEYRRITTPVVLEWTFAAVTTTTLPAAWPTVMMLSRNWRDPLRTPTSRRWRCGALPVQRVFGMMG